MPAPVAPAAAKAAATAARAVALRHVSRWADDQGGGPGPARAGLVLLVLVPLGVVLALVLLVGSIAGVSQQACAPAGGGPLPADFSGPGSLGGVGGTGISRPLVAQVRSRSPFAGTNITTGRYSATAYGPPWGGIQGAGIATSGGLPIRGGAPRWYMIAVDPRLDADRDAMLGGMPTPRAPSPEPDWEHTVHCIGDLHAGAITDVRMNAVSRDVERLRTPALHLQVGDATERGAEAQDEAALGFLGRLPGPWVTVLGNHDTMRNERSAADWASVYGQPSQNFTVDLDFVRLVVVGPNRSEPGQRAGRLSNATLAFLERELAGTERDCWVACHWPLLRTVMGDPRLHFTSAMAAFHAKPDERIRDLLARHRNAKLWLSGHTHSPLSAPGLIKRARLGPKRSIVAINASALVGIGKRRDPHAPLCSLFLTHRPGRIEVRCRDHRAGEWRNLRGRRVVGVSA